MSSKNGGLSKEQLALAKVLEFPENRYCVDCGTKAPKWASLNIGCFMCIECSGIHRQVGVHITKVSDGRVAAPLIASCKSCGSAESETIHFAD